jgi:hypothetical protein
MTESCLQFAALGQWLFTGSDLAFLSGEVLGCGSWGGQDWHVVGGVQVLNAWAAPGKNYWDQDAHSAEMENP